MKKLIWSSLLISLVVSLMVTIILNILTATYYQASPATSLNSVLTGLDAIHAIIENVGFFGYIKGVVGPFVIYVLGVFSGCVVTGLVNKENRVKI